MSRLSENTHSFESEVQSHPMPAPQRARTPAQNAVASSSKVPLPEHTPLPGTSILPRGVALNRTKDKPVAAGTQQHQDFSDLTSSRSSTPPPEPKALARIPAGPSSNPLSIRPSHSSFPLPLPAPPYLRLPRPKQRNLSSSGAVGLSSVRQTPHSVVSAGSTSSKLAKSPLNSRSSPSRSPPANPPANPASNCKRTESEDVVDMDISNPPSPVTRPPSLPPPPADASASISEPRKDQVPLPRETLTGLLDRGASDIYDQIALLEEARTDCVSKLSRISHPSSTLALEQRLTESPVVPRASPSVQPPRQHHNRVPLF
ncbi:hypothetical protein B0H14DRAFT_1651042 [Mycena olivaceomarginata]|nr:hypothetical protein B0H14DRAFT_1651042 [Mycena olivaceomarginata]